MSKIGFSSNPSNGSSHTWRSRRRFNYSSSKGGWQAKGAVPPAPSAPTLNNNTDLQDMNDATGLAAKMRGMAVMYNSYSDFPTEAYTGSFAYARDTNELYVWTGANPSSDVWYGDRAIVMGGNNNVNLLSSIDYYNISNPGTNASSFGDLIAPTGWLHGAASDGTYGLSFGGIDYADSPQTYLNTIQYVTVSTLSDMSDFGDLTSAGSRGGVFGDPVYAVCTINSGQAQTAALGYITITTPGNTTTFGNLTETTMRSPATFNDNTYGVLAGGNRGATSKSDLIDYVTVATPSNATVFGNLTNGVHESSGASDETYGIVYSGYRANGSLNVIDYVTIATPSNASDFGDPANNLAGNSTCSNGTYACSNGNDFPSPTNVIEYITIQSPSNASDFGDLVDARKVSAATSGNAS